MCGRPPCCDQEHFYLIGFESLLQAALCAKAHTCCAVQSLNHKARRDSQPRSGSLLDGKQGHKILFAMTMFGLFDNKTAPIRAEDCMSENEKVWVCGAEKKLKETEACSSSLLYRLQ